MKYQNPRPSRATTARAELTRRVHIAYRLAIRRGAFNPAFFGGKLFQEYLAVQQVHVESVQIAMAARKPAQAEESFVQRCASKFAEFLLVCCASLAYVCL